MTATETQRLREWLNGVQVSARTGFPTYANPGELKKDLGWLLSDNERLREALQLIADENDGEPASQWIARAALAAVLPIAEERDRLS